MPQVTAKPLSLTVRPFKVANLCFEVGGILGESFAELGAQVFAFDFDDVYKSFRDASTLQGNAGRLEFDSVRIDKLTKTLFTPSFPPGTGHPPGPESPRRFALAALRAEPVKAALNKAILSRENGFITKYGKSTEIASLLKAHRDDKTFRLDRLTHRSQQRTNNLLFAYSRSGRSESDVVTKTITDIISKHHEEPFVTTATVSDKTTTSRVAHEHVVSANAVKNNDLAGAVEIQRVENTGYEFRMPFIDEDMRNDRDVLVLSDQTVSHFLQTHYLDRLEDVYKNELASIDADVNQMQVAYLNTILMSPIDGVVTGVYKHPGNPVAAGEPVFRVENNDNILIVARISCRGPIVVGSDTTEGSMLQVTTRLFDLPNSPVTTVEAKIVAARIQGEDDQWEVIAKRPNTDNAGKGGPLFPLGYSFDYDDTEVSVFGPNEI